MKSKASKLRSFNPNKGFEIKNSAWTFWVCLLVSIGCLVTFFVLFSLKEREVITSVAVLALSLISAVGCYASIYEKLTYSKGVYKYYRPFGKNKIASVEDIASVRISSYHYSYRYGRGSKIRIFFYDDTDNILIKILDDGTLANNEAFIESLKYNRINILNEQKNDLWFIPKR